MPRQVSRKQLMVAEWEEQRGGGGGADVLGDSAPDEVLGALHECAQLRQKIEKNSGAKSALSKQLKAKEAEAEQLK